MKAIETTDRSGAESRGLGSARRVLRGVHAGLDHIPYAVIGLSARVFPAAVFWMSGQTKVDGWSITPTTFYLFANEYQLPLVPPALAAWLATFAEHFFPALLVLGLCTRLSALALMVMTLVIEIFVYPAAWPTHGVWITCFLILIARGPGSLSLDHLLGIDRAK